MAVQIRGKVQRGNSLEERHFWLFQANPRGGDNLQTDLSKKAPGSTIWWRANIFRDPRGRMLSGDGVVMWQTPGTVPEAAGVYALGRIAGKPKIKNEVWQVPVRLEHLRDVNFPIQPATLRAQKSLSEVLVLRPRGFMGTNFHISESEWGAICALWGESAGPGTQSPPPSVRGPVMAKGTDEHEVRFRENELIAAYFEHAKKCGLRFEHQYSLKPKDGSSLFKCDLYEKSKGILIEAKGDITRESIRMAIGELFDYRQFVDAPPKLAVLLPDRPADDLIQLLADLNIAFIWQTPSLKFTDNADGQFSQLS